MSSVHDMTVRILLKLMARLFERLELKRQRKERYSVPVNVYYSSSGGVIPNPTTDYVWAMLSWYVDNQEWRKRCYDCTIGISIFPILRRV